MDRQNITVILQNETPGRSVPGGFSIESNLYFCNLIITYKSDAVKHFF